MSRTKGQQKNDSKSWSWNCCGAYAMRLKSALLQFGHISGMMKQRILESAGFEPNGLWLGQPPAGPKWSLRAQMCLLSGKYS